MSKSFRALATLSFTFASIFFGTAGARADQLAAMSPDVLSAPSPARSTHPAIFNSREIHSINVAQFSNWTDMMGRWERDQRAAADCATGSAGAADCAPREWRDLVQELKGLPLRTMLQRVNSALNRHPYITSVENWGVANHWETPYEFLRRSGQCQDYAIAKFMLLRALGVPNDDLRIVVLRDVERQLDHAVVVAYVDGEALMLDSLRETVVPVAEATAYRPYYSINETGWWLHLTGGAPPRPVPHAMTAARVRAPAEQPAKPIAHVASSQPEALRLSMIEQLAVN